MEILLRKETIREFDVTSCKENLEKIITEYIKAKYSYINIKKQGEEYYNSSSGVNYDYRPECFTIKYSDRVANKIGFKIDNEREAIEVGYKINELYKKFTDGERDFFDIILLNGNAQKFVEDKYRLSKHGLEPIKQSCIVKSALHFGVAVYR